VAAASYRLAAFDWLDFEHPANYAVTVQRLPEKKLCQDAHVWTDGEDEQEQKALSILLCSPYATPKTSTIHY
jgi:hypothetical protein